MAPAAALNLTVFQEDVFGEHDPTNIKAIADAMLLALQTPLKLEWETSLKDQCGVSKASVIVSVELGADAKAWPPRKFTLRVIPSEPTSGKANLLSTSGFEVSSSISATQFAELLEVGSSNLAFAESDNAGGYADGMGEAELENNDTLANVATKEPVPVAEESASASLQQRIAEMALVDSDRSRGLIQASCLQQWHGNTCGHHAVFNIRCLLGGHPERLQDYHFFWQSTLENIQLLARHGEATGRWPASRVTKGVADDIHLRYLIESDETLHGKVSFAQSAESLLEQLQKPDSEMSLAINEIVCGRSRAHGFLLGATNHWYAAVAIAIPRNDAALEQAGGAQLIFCDSYNLPLVRLHNVQDVEELAETLAERRREAFVDKLRTQPEWEHRPSEHLETAVIEGIPEWWKGIHKSSVFWREQPLKVWMYNKTEELNKVSSYLHNLSQALGTSIDEPHSAREY